LGWVLLFQSATITALSQTTERRVSFLIEDFILRRSRIFYFLRRSRIFPRSGKFFSQTPNPA
jgi:hypothetical protein